ncbi:NUDIX domain-containing protein [Viridibacillus sp. YIM B01967]|uniref:NUDIX domain-containing protein n=1 Tax=Viridibacillus soli TaxID=2798301 RepID=A0ABS1H499_9BACL|nr:NUDIX domain-containing protein [Viridibacillus soli]MBK3494242.1 NUDIX domain-containing protein [Viridibacillus soli]
MSYVSEIRKLVGHLPLIIPGSVVLIVNEMNEVLLQHRSDGGWGLPGGLMGLGESLEETAKREVLEETGLVIDDLKLLGVFSGTDYYFKVANGDELYSVTAVFLTRNAKGEMLKDDVETLDLQYFNVDKLPNTLTEEYSGYINPYKEVIKEVNK